MTLFTNRIAFAAALLAAAILASPRLAAQGGKPVTGTDVLEMMRKKYDGKWYQNLMFTQKTTMAGRNGGEPTIQTWYESLEFHPASGAYLRIDTGDLANGNGSLSTADSTWGVRAGKLTSSRGSGNPFLALIENVYLQPVAATVKQLEPLKFDLTRSTDVMWEGRPAWAIGASSPSDTTSPQFWIDKERLIVVRMLLSRGANANPFDIHLGGMVQTGGGWLATKVVMLSNGTPQQTEEYSDWKTNVKLDPALFDITAWTTAKHWAKQP